MPSALACGPDGLIGRCRGSLAVPPRPGGVAVQGAKTSTPATHLPGFLRRHCSSSHVARKVHSKPAYLPRTKRLSQRATFSTRQTALSATAPISGEPTRGHRTCRSCMSQTITVMVRLPLQRSTGSDSTTGPSGTWILYPAWTKPTWSGSLRTFVRTRGFMASSRIRREIAGLVGGSKGVHLCRHVRSLGTRNRCRLGRDDEVDIAGIPAVRCRSPRLEQRSRPQ